MLGIGTANGQADLSPVYRTGNMCDFNGTQLAPRFTIPTATWYKTARCLCLEPSSTTPSAKYRPARPYVGQHHPCIAVQQPVCGNDQVLHPGLPGKLQSSHLQQRLRRRAADQLPGHIHLHQKPIRRSCRLQLWTEGQRVLPLRGRPPAGEPGFRHLLREQLPRLAAVPQEARQELWLEPGQRDLPDPDQ